jgi:dUTP pyrophosphatase
MEKKTVEIQIKLEDYLFEPVYSSEDAAGADLKSSESAIIPAGEHRLVKTGVRIKMPKGYVGLIHPRSGLALKHGITVLNAPGTIDADYTGEIGVILYNTSAVDFVVAHGDRIAQIVFQEYQEAKFKFVDEFDEESARGSDGFGSTGI